MKIGFDSNKYLKLQSEKILERVNQFDKLYLEFGGKLFHDNHAKRVLPGYDANAKVKLLQKLKDKVEVVICLYSGHIENNKMISDTGISYDIAVFRLIDDLRRYDLEVNSVVVTRYDNNPATNKFIKKLERRNIKTYKHRATKGYPTDIDVIVSEEGYGKNPYIETNKPIVVVTAPGPGSGKLATCLSQLYHENQLGNNAGYAKFETFPVWDIPLKHPINIAYEAATADLNDINMLDSYHMEAYGKATVNYNRDIESFPLLKRILEKITGKESMYKSPTDMGVNAVSAGIIDEEVVKESSKQEIIRRYFIAKCDYLKGNCDIDQVDKIKLMMESLELKEEDRPVVMPARKREKLLKKQCPQQDIYSAVAIDIDGKIITGKSSSLMDAPAAAILNAIKYLANIPDDMALISPVILEPIQKLKHTISQTFSDITPLDTEEILIAVSISAATNPTAQLALSKLPDLQNAKAHSTTIMNRTDENIYTKLQIDTTCDDIFPTKNLFYN